jgi:hypothetical protein
LYKVSGDEIICPNHFQSDVFEHDRDNEINLVESSSLYRRIRTQQLINEYPKADVTEAARVLRDRKGLNGKDIGMGNEKSLNQFIAHHAVLFKPEDRLLWVSSSPFQMGAFGCYNLDSVFANDRGLNKDREICEKQFTIAEDPFLKTRAWQDYKNFKMLKQYILGCAKAKATLHEGFEMRFIASNPESYLTYWILGDYYKQRSDETSALRYYRKALTKEVATGKEENKIKHLIKEIEKKRSGV